MNEQPDHERYQLMLGAYVLGALNPADRAAVDSHVTSCAACRRELAEFAIVPGLLSRAAEPGVDRAVSTEQPQALQGALRSLSSARRTRRRWIGAGVASAAACALAAGVGIGMVTAPQQVEQVASARTVTLTSDGRMGGSADLAPRPWGTELRLDLHDLPAKQRLEVVAVQANGHSEPAATWTVPDAGRIQLTGATSIRPDSVQRIDIRTDDGTVLASSSD